MDPELVETLARELRARRDALLKQVESNEADLRLMEAEREPEFEEQAQEERDALVLAGLDDRSSAEVAAIGVALDRIAEGTYGVCGGCGQPIAEARLRALPTTPLCVDCATAREQR